MIDLIKNRLAELLAQRQLKITKVAKDTGISRNTITSTAQNDGTMIKLETIDILCNYLGVTPNEFFEFIPVTSKIDIMVTNFELEYDKKGEFSFADFDTIKYNADIFLDLTYQRKKYEFNLECNSYLSKEDSNKTVFNILFLNKDELSIFRKIMNEIDSYMFSSEISKLLIENLKEDFKKQFMDYKDDYLSKEDKELFFLFEKQEIIIPELNILDY
ncbi:TPA: helix-turn-helix transcriptional regulator [Streptococcus suis]|nr:helix-turn-helix transcriptional regulator [Streptococcus suis]